MIISLSGINYMLVAKEDMKLIDEETEVEKSVELIIIACDE